VPEAIQFPQSARRLERRRILNDTTIRSIKPPAKGAIDYFDDLTPGLSLRVTANDVRTWTVFYRDKSARQKRLALGRYPAVKLVDARELARDAQRSVAHGGDPAVEKRTAREALTFGALAAKYIDDYAKPKKKSWQEDQRQLDADLLPKWKTRPAVEISAKDLLAILNAK
jgi:Arm DNA-binding domain